MTNSILKQAMTFIRQLPRTQIIIKHPLRIRKQKANTVRKKKYIYRGHYYKQIHNFHQPVCPSDRYHWLILVGPADILPTHSFCPPRKTRTLNTRTRTTYYPIQMFRKYFPSENDHNRPKQRTQSTLITADCVHSLLRHVSDVPELTMRTSHFITVVQIIQINRHNKNKIVEKDLDDRSTEDFTRNILIKDKKQKRSRHGVAVRGPAGRGSSACA